MSTITVRPNETLDNGDSTLTGAASRHAALSDDSDASYVGWSSGHDALRVGLAEPTPSAGALLKRTQTRVRVARVTSGSASQSALDVTTFFDPAGGLGNGYEAESTILSSVIQTTVIGTTPVQWPSSMDVEVLLDPSGTLLRVYELYVDFTYVDAPVISVDAPTSTVSDTNLPTVEFSETLDADGGPQTHFEIKVFTDAQYGAGGFDPDTSTPTVESGITASDAVSWQITEPLVDDVYRAYGRVAQEVNGTLHWSDWDFSQWTQATDLPGVPLDFDVIAENADGRLLLEVDTDPAGDATSDYVEIQRELDDGSWRQVRTVLGDGLVEVVSDAAEAWELEAPNGVTQTFRVRAVHEYSAENFAYSDWLETAGTWTSTSQWLKHPTDPSLNLATDIFSHPVHKQRAVRMGVFQGLDSSTVTVVTDRRGPAAGEVAFWLDDAAERDALDALLDAQSPVLLQGAAQDAFVDRWVVLASQDSARPVNKLEVEEAIDTFAWTEVARPDGNLEAWPD